MALPRAYEPLVSWFLRQGFGRDRLTGWPAICQTGPGGLPEWLADLAPKEPRARQGGGKFFLDGHGSMAFRKLKTSKNFGQVPHDMIMIFKMSLSFWLIYIHTHTHNFTCFKWTLKGIPGMSSIESPVNDVVTLASDDWLFWFLTPILHGDMWSFILQRPMGLGSAYPCLSMYPLLSEAFGPFSMLLGPTSGWGFLGSETLRISGYQTKSNGSPLQL